MELRNSSDSEVFEASFVLQSPGPPFGTEAFFKPGAGRLVLIRGGATEGPEGRLLGRSEQGLSTLGQVQAQKAAELLNGHQGRALWEHSAVLLPRSREAKVVPVRIYKHGDESAEHSHAATA